MVAAMTRTSTGFDREAPSGRTSRSCRKRSSFTWNAGFDVANFIQKHRAAMGGLEHADTVAIRAGVGALERAE